MSESVLYLTAKAIGEVIAAGIPDLAGRVVVVQAPPALPESYPACAVLVEPTLTFEASHDLEVIGANGQAVTLPDGRALMEAGVITTTIKVWLAARTPAQRETLQARVTRLWFGNELAAGRLDVELRDLVVDGFASPAAWPVALYLDTGEWRDELAFSERRWAYVNAVVAVPILIARDEVWRVTQMVTALTARTNVDVTAPVVTYDDTLTTGGSASPAV